MQMQYILIHPKADNEKSSPGALSASVRMVVLSRRLRTAVFRVGLGPFLGARPSLLARAGE
jgi:hypothetical protein